MNRMLLSSLPCSGSPTKVQNCNDLYVTVLHKEVHCKWESAQQKEW